MKTKILDLIDFEKVNTLLEGFNKTTGFVTAILDLEGTVLSQSGWRQICTEFHRVHPETAKKCRISDTELAGKMAEGEKYHFYKCLNGLVDVAVPIVINGEHIANLFSGQFFFEEPNRDYFSKQAEKYKFDNNTYLEALDKVPVVSEEKVKTAMDFLIEMTLLISEMTQQKIEQIELNKTLKESEEKYRQLYESNQMPISIYDTQTLNFLSVNNAFIEKYGYTEEEFLKMSVLDIRPESEIEKLKHSVEINDKGLANAGVFLHKKKNGEIIQVEIIRYDLVFEGKNAKLVFANDITERKQIEKELNESAKKYRDLVNMAQEGIWAIDENNITTFANPSMANMLGYSSEEMIGKSLFDFMDEAGEKAANENLERRKAGLKEQHDFEFICKNGKRIFCALVTSPILDKTGKYQGAIAGIINITERKQFLKKLQERNEYIESVMENMPIGFALNTIDDGDVKYMNNRFEEIYGWSRDILTNTSTFFDKVFPDSEYRKKIKTQIITDMQSGDPQRMVWKDLKIITSTGEERFVLAYNIPLIDQNLMISTVQDTTKRKLVEDEIKKHRENLEELVKERTKNLDEKNEELERMNKLFVGRELRMVELKEIIKKLKSKR